VSTAFIVWQALELTEHSYGKEIDQEQTTTDDDVGSFNTPPETPKKSLTTGLISPKKMGRIPETPHRPGMDIFWNQEFINEWNDEHSPKKPMINPSQASQTDPSPKKGGQKAATKRAAKKAFIGSKYRLAENFLQELDAKITGGRLQKLSSSTGGIKIHWTNKLNTTAGRAHWKRETIRSKEADGSSGSERYRHHASIELAEKVIDDENRLLNVIAHEFCHLANFMVSDVTGNPHGKEFKAWAAKCSAAFPDRSIEVTTKHSYDIDFKYVWECTSCGIQYKRHSKSLNPERHRCGSCKSLLRQTKPAPRATVNPSEYQKFIGEHMKSIKKENPGSPQKDVMRLAAERWARRNQGDARAGDSTDSSKRVIDEVAVQLESLALKATQ
jgi:predicted SprT family Zn-dependent metalloprotease